MTLEPTKFREEPLHENGMPMGALSVTAKRPIEGIPRSIVLSQSSSDDLEKYPPVLGGYLHDEFVKQLIQEEKNALLDRLVMERWNDAGAGRHFSNAYNQAVEENHKMIEKER